MKPETYLVRPAQPADFDQVFKLIREFASFLNVPEKVRTSVSQMLEDKDSFQCLVAVENDEVIGFATYFYVYYSWSGKAIYLDDLYVSGGDIMDFYFHPRAKTPDRINRRGI